METNHNPTNHEKRNITEILKGWAEVADHWAKATQKNTLQARIFELYKQELKNVCLPADLSKQYEIFHDCLASATNAALYFDANVDEFVEKVAAVLEENKPKEGELK